MKQPGKQQSQEHRSQHGYFEEVLQQWGASGVGESEQAKVSEAKERWRCQTGKGYCLAKKLFMFLGLCCSYLYKAVVHSGTPQEAGNHGGHSRFLCQRYPFRYLK
ncbi:hypothetical protein SRHO_G00171220 [Serrasalmus rhombeus]